MPVCRLMLLRHATSDATAADAMLYDAARQRAIRYAGYTRVTRARTRTC